MDVDNLGAHIALTCLVGERCSIFFEPLGTELTLTRGDIIRVASDAFMTGDVEVSLVPGGISLAFTREMPLQVWDGSGNAISL